MEALLGALAAGLVLLLLGWSINDVARAVRDLPCELVKPRRIRNMRLKPGDVVVVRCERLMNDEQYQHLRAWVKQFVPENEVLILDSNLEIEVLSRHEIGKHNGRDRDGVPPENAPLTKVEVN